MQKTDALNPQHDMLASVFVILFVKNVKAIIKQIMKKTRHPYFYYAYFTDKLSTKNQNTITFRIQWQAAKYVHLWRKTSVLRATGNDKRTYNMAFQDKKKKQGEGDEFNTIKFHRSNWAKPREYYISEVTCVLPVKKKLTVKVNDSSNVAFPKRRSKLCQPWINLYAEEFAGIMDDENSSYWAASKQQWISRWSSYTAFHKRHDNGWAEVTKLC
jgi:hypothetical protein